MKSASGDWKTSCNSFCWFFVCRIQSCIGVSPFLSYKRKWKPKAFPAYTTSFIVFSRYFLGKEDDCLSVDWLCVGNGPNRLASQCRAVQQHDRPSDLSIKTTPLADSRIHLARAWMRFVGNSGSQRPSVTSLQRYWCPTFDTFSSFICVDYSLINFEPWVPFGNEFRNFNIKKITIKLKYVLDVCFVFNLWPLWTCWTSHGKRPTFQFT